MTAEKPVAVLLDTNMLMAQAAGIDVLGQLADRYPHLAIHIVPGTLKELDALSDTGGAKQRRQARLAKEIAQRQHLNMAVQSANHVDDALLAAATRLNAYIATVDRELRRRARTAGIPVLTITRRSQLTPA